MALPLLAPLAPLLPVLKVLALGSIKFVGLGLGAAIAPVLTANFLVGMSAGTPLKYAKFRHRQGMLPQEELDVVQRADELVQKSLKDSSQHLDRAQARAFLKEIMVGTVASMKETVVSLPAKIAAFTRHMIDFSKRLLGSSGSKK